MGRAGGCGSAHHVDQALRRAPEDDRRASVAPSHPSVQHRPLGHYRCALLLPRSVQLPPRSIYLLRRLVELLPWPIQLLPRSIQLLHICTVRIVVGGLVQLILGASSFDWTSGSLGRFSSFLGRSAPPHLYYMHCGARPLAAHPGGILSLSVQAVCAPSASCLRPRFPLYASPQPAVCVPSASCMRLYTRKFAHEGL